MYNVTLDSRQVADRKIKLEKKIAIRGTNKELQEDVFKEELEQSDIL